MVARVYFDCFVNKTARPYILFMSKAIDQSLFAFYCTKPFLISDRPPESNQARLTYALQLSQHFRPRLTTRMVIPSNPLYGHPLIWTPRCLLPRRLSFKENVRSKEGGKEPTVCTLPIVPCSSSPVTRVSRSPLPREKRSA